MIFRAKTFGGRRHLWCERHVRYRAGRDRAETGRHSGLRQFGRWLQRSNRHGPRRGHNSKKTTAQFQRPSPLKEIPQAVTSVISRQELDDRKSVVSKISEALRYTAGVATQTFSTRSRIPIDFCVRGFDAGQSGVYLDNLNLFSYGFGNFQISPFMLERVDVLKRPASGSTAAPVPVALSTWSAKRPTDDPLYYAEIGINSNGNAFTGFDFSDKVGSGDTMTYRLTGRSPERGYTDPTRDLRLVVPQLTIRRMTPRA